MSKLFASDRAHIDIKELPISDTALPKPGEIVPCDDIFISGYNIASATGESDAVKRVATTNASPSGSGVPMFVVSFPRSRFSSHTALTPSDPYLIPDLHLSPESFTSRLVLLGNASKICHLRRSQTVIEVA